MPTIPLGPNFQSFSDVAHTLALEREAAIQDQLRRDQLNAEIDTARQNQAGRQQEFGLRQQQNEQQMALAQFKAEADANLRSMEEERLQKAQNIAYGANNFKRAVETGVMLDDSGTKYVPITEQDQPELWKARQDFLGEKHLNDTRLREQMQQQARQHMTAQQLNYLKAGFKLEEQADEMGNPKIVARPIAPTDPEYGWWEEQQTLAERKTLTVADRIAIEKAKVDAQNASTAQRTAMLNEARGEYKDLRGDLTRQMEDLHKLEKDFRANPFSTSGANANANALEAALKDAGVAVPPGTNLVDIPISALSASKQGKLRSFINQVVEDQKAQKAYVEQKIELEGQRKKVKDLQGEAEKARMRLDAIRSGRGGGETQAAEAQPLISQEDFLTNTGTDAESPGVLRFYNAVFKDMSPDSPEAAAAWYQMSPDDRRRMSVAGVGHIARRILAAQAGGR